LNPNELMASRALVDRAGLSSWNCGALMVKTAIQLYKKDELD
jgi:hypothetical protein